MTDVWLRAGVGRAMVTPPVGIRLAGTLRDALSAGVESELTATVLAVEGPQQTVALVACDLLLLPREAAMSIRQRVGLVLGTPAANVLVNTSHTHAVPSHPAWQEFDDAAGEQEARLVRTYYDALEDLVVGAAASAARNLQPARAAYGEGRAWIGVNRREQLPDGTMVLGENADGIVDPTVGVIRFDLADGRPLATVLHYACHPDVLGPKSTLISPDYVGAARHVVEQLTQAPALFLQGTAGDIDPRVGIVNGADGVDEMRRLGTELGCEVVRVLQGLNTARRRAHRVAWKSAASVVTGWNYADVPATQPVTVGVATESMDMPLRPLPSEASARQTLAEAETAAAEVDTKASALSDRLVARRRLDWARLQLEAVLAGAAPTLPFEMQAIRINDVALVAAPGELFVEIGLAIKRASPFSHTLVSGYSNGLYFYVPTAKAFAQGGYEVESHRNFMQPSGPTPEWEHLICECSGRLLKQLASR